MNHTETTLPAGKLPPQPRPCTRYRAETWTPEGATEPRHYVRRGITGHLVETAAGALRTWKSREAAEAAARELNEKAATEPTKTP